MCVCVWPPQVLKWLASLTSKPARVVSSPIHWVPHSYICVCVCVYVPVCVYGGELRYCNG